MMTLAGNLETLELVDEPIHLELDEATRRHLIEQPHAAPAKEHQDVPEQELWPLELPEAWLQ